MSSKEYIHDRKISIFDLHSEPILRIYMATISMDRPNHSVTVIRDESPPLSSIIPSIVLGGGSFSEQSHPAPESLPVRSIVQRAFDAGIRAFDTSPYYGPSEVLFGDAFSQPAITENFNRTDYILMSKVGRIAAAKFDYSPSWIRSSINRSLERLKTSYLDVVFCHDVEYVLEEEVLEAVGVLFELVEKKVIRYVGISGYPVEKLVRLAHKIRAKYNRPLDAVQCWAQMTLQNTNLEKRGLFELRAAGVDCIFNSSPLAIGLLCSSGVPLGSLGDWHPAPGGLREVVLQASDWVEEQGENLAALSIRYSVFRLLNAERKCPGASTIFAVRSVEELNFNLRALASVFERDTSAPEKGTNMRSPLWKSTMANRIQLRRDEPLFNGVRERLGEWIDFTFTSPESGWDTRLKRIVPVVHHRENHL
jgi:D-arabinose 1-dehydrogenase